MVSFAYKHSTHTPIVRTNLNAQISFGTSFGFQNLPTTKLVYKKTAKIMDDQNLVRAFELAGKRMQEKRDRMCACIHAQRSPDWQRFVQPQQCVKLLSSSRSKHCTPSLSVAAAAPARPLPQRTVCTVRRDSACAHARAIDRERERERERERKKETRIESIIWSLKSNDYRFRFLQSVRSP